MRGCFSERLLPADPNANCADYGGDSSLLYETYDDCFVSAMKDRIRKQFGCIPPVLSKWVVNQLSSLEFFSNQFSQNLASNLELIFVKKIYMFQKLILTDAYR